MVQKEEDKMVEKTKKEAKKWVKGAAEEDRGVIGLRYGKQFGVR